MTGGSGSFGQSFVKEALKHGPKAIRVFSRGEYLQAMMRQDISDPRLRFLIGDVRDQERLRRAMDGVDIVIHAAAMKRVESCEYDPIEACKTNIEGTANVANAAIDTKVDKVIGISSDKAVEPVNLYGASKLAMERIILSGNGYGDGRFAIIRSGNFTESRGNVAELWERQIRETGIATITSPQMARYWITTEDLAKLTLKCLEVMQGGEIFIPKMKEVPIMETVGAMGISTIAVCGIRPGERLREKLWNSMEEAHDKGDYWVIGGTKNYHL